MKQVKWKFKGTEVYFVNPENKMASAVFKQANRLGIDPAKTKIEIVNEFFTPELYDEGCRSCNGNTSSPTKPTLQVVSETTKTGPTPDDMRDMLGLLDQLSSTSGNSTDALDDSSSTGFDDRLAL